MRLRPVAVVTSWPGVAEPSTSQRSLPSNGTNHDGGTCQAVVRMCVRSIEESPLRL